MRFVRAAACALLALAAIASSPPPRASSAPSGARPPSAPPPAPPVLLVPSLPDSYPPDGESVPLIVPGRPSALDTLISPQARARLYFSLAQDMEKIGQLSSALVAYRNAYLLDTTAAGVATRIGHCYLALGEPRLAAAAFLHEVTRHPGDVEAARELGVALAQSGRAADGVRQLALLTRKRPGDDETWSALGFAYLMAGRARDAETALRRALSLGPPRASEHRDLGSALAAQGRAREARESFRRAMALDAKDAGAWLNLANLERREGNAEAALAAYREAESRDSTLAPALEAQARLYEERGRARDADAAYRRWLRASPDDLSARLKAIQFFVTEGRADVALEIAREAVRLAPGSGDAWLMHGVALDATGDQRGALASFRRAQSLADDATTRQRATRLIATLRASAPDSLRTLFERDSVEHAPRRR